MSPASKLVDVDMLSDELWPQLGSQQLEYTLEQASIQVISSVQVIL